MNLLHRYIFWTEERGTLHYDVMVTAILLFIFVSPHFINFKAKPVPDTPLASNSVLVKNEGSAGASTRYLYEIPADKLRKASTDDEMRAAILDVVQPIAGTVTLENYNPVRDGKGHVMAYDATVLRSRQ
jgi:hypothetical protein